MRSADCSGVDCEIKLHSSLSPRVAASLKPWHRNSRTQLDRFCSALQSYWDQVLVGIYPDLERRLQREAQRLRNAIDEVGPQATAATLHPRLRIDLAATSTVAMRNIPMSTGYQPLRLRGLVLKPMISARYTYLTNLGYAPTTAWIAAPTPALFGSVQPAPPNHGLALLLGVSRARVLRRPRQRPATTTSLADELGLAPSTISHHLSALAAAEIVQGMRQGTAVVYVLTDHGYRLLSI